MYYREDLCTEQQLLRYSDKMYLVNWGKVGRREYVEKYIAYYNTCNNNIFILQSVLNFNSSQNIVQALNDYKCKSGYQFV